MALTVYFFGAKLSPTLPFLYDYITPLIYDYEQVGPLELIESIIGLDTHLHSAQMHTHGHVDLHPFLYFGITNNFHCKVFYISSFLKIKNRINLKMY